MKKIYISTIIFALIFFGKNMSFGQIVISGYMANPASTDNDFEYVQFKATQDIDFSATPYSMVWCNNGTAVANGWITGGVLSYAFNLNSGSVTKGQVFYVGGSAKLINGAASTDISSENWIKVINTVTTAGDSFGSANATFGNGGANADGVAIFNGLASTLTASTIPIDAIFFGTGVGTANPASGGYILPTNDRYNNSKGSFGDGTNKYLFSDPADGAFVKLTGNYNTSTNNWVVSRVASIVESPTLLKNIESRISINENPTVNLTVSTPATSETNPPAITVTATVSYPVIGDQTVSLATTGTVAAGDYTLSNTIITILSGQTVGTVSFTAIDDILSEGSETATLTISNPSAGLVLGATITADITIADNDCDQLLSLKSTSTSANGAEISAFDPINDRIYTVAGPALEYYTLDANGLISSATNVPFGFTSVGNNILPNSVAIKNGIVAASFAIQNNVTFAQQPGVVAFYNANDGSFISQVTVGYLPDMLTFTPDGTKILTANEGEPNSYNQATSFDPEGSVSIIDVSGGFAAPPVVTAGFTSFNSQIASLKAAGVRIYSPSADPTDPNGPNATVAQDLEPEYITFNADATKAFVTLQEANAIAELDMATSTITQILPLGLKDHSMAGNGIDASDRDINFPNTPPSSGVRGKINILNWPVKGMYQPDAISSFTVAGNTYYITANEGDAREWPGFAEELRVGDATYTLDPTVFPNSTNLKLLQNLGRLNASRGTGSTDADAEFEEIHVLGARSFSIWNSSFGTPLYDSGDQLEQITAAQVPNIFNSTDGITADFDSRSDNKGPEPESVTTGMVNGILYAFVGSERTGDIFVYDISNPMTPVFKQYINTPADRGVEGLIFVSASDSPTGKALVISSAENSKTVSVYEFAAPDCSQNVISGVVTEDTDGGTIDGTPLSVSGAYISLFKSTNTTAVPDLVAEVTSGTGVYTFPAVASDTYTLVIGTSATGSNLASYPNVGGFSMKASAEGVAGTIGDGNANGKTKVIVSGNSTIYGSARVAAPAGVGFASTQNIALPIKLVSFEGKSIKTGNELTWKTSSEVNFSHFEIQRSNDAQIFKKIGEVSGNGNTIEKQNYSFLDTEIQTINNAYYRLKSVDIDGKSEFSKIIFINKAEEKVVVGNIYPNPSTGSEVFLNIYSTENEQLNVNIYDFTGKILSSEKLILSNGENKVKLNIGETAKGLLIIKVENKSKSYFRKLVK